MNLEQSKYKNRQSGFVALVAITIIFISIEATLLTASDTVFRVFSTLHKIEHKKQTHYDTLSCLEHAKAAQTSTEICE